MRRLASYVLVIALVLVPTMGTRVASAGTTHWSGNFVGGGTMSFDLRRAHGHKSVRHFDWNQVDIDCATFSSFTSGTIDGPIDVVDGRFERVNRGGGIRTKVWGTFTRRPFPRAEGFLRQRGVVFGNSDEYCDTGAVQWIAHPGF